MANRILPGAYVTMNDLSYFPEGDTSLTVGYVLKAKKGAVNEAVLVTDPTDFLTKYTFTGAPTIKDDPTFWSILKILAKTNQVYIVRAAKNALYGGAVAKAATEIGVLEEASAEDNTITIKAQEAPQEGAKFMIKGTGLPAKKGIDGYYTISVVAERTGFPGEYNIIPVEPVPYDVSKQLAEVLQVKLMAAPLDAVTESFANPEFEAENLGDDLMLITGADPGAYNGEFYFDIISAVDNPNQLVYAKANGFDFDTIQLNVRTSKNGEVVETFVFSRDPEAKAVDGTSLYVDNIVAGSAYIKIVNNTKVDANLLPSSTLTGMPLKSGAGSDGEEVTADFLSGKEGPLEAFRSKTVPVSIIGNGCSNEAETVEFQQALLELAEDRKDLIVFLNSPYEKERGTLGSAKASNIVDYKKNDLVSSSFYGAMYCPHVNASDTFNSRKVKIGSDAIAIAGWLDVINNLGYPYAYAGPQNGLVTGVTCDWKIGDESNEAATLNDASINYIAFDGKVGRYYMQCQNTLQIANSALRNLGCLFNVLDIKEHLATALKEYSQLPITDTLRRDILNSVNDYLGPMQGIRFYNYSFQDVTSAADIAQDTLRYAFYIDVTRYAQRIYVFMNIVNSTFDWTIVQSA